MSQAGEQIITIHTLPNISRSDGNQTIKFGQLIEYNSFFKNYVENEAGRLVPGLFLFLKKLCIRQKPLVGILFLIESVDQDLDIQ